MDVHKQHLVPFQHIIKFKEVLLKSSALLQPNKSQIIVQIIITASKNSTKDGQQPSYTMYASLRMLNAQKFTPHNHITGFTGSPDMIRIGCRLSYTFHYHAQEIDISHGLHRVKYSGSEICTQAYDKCQLDVSVSIHVHTQATES